MWALCEVITVPELFPSQTHMIIGRLLTRSYRKSLPCSYTLSTSSTRRRNPDVLRHQHVFEQGPLPVPVNPHLSSSSEKPVKSEQTIPRNVDFPSVLFLDSVISKKYHVEIPRQKLPIPLGVASIIGDTSQQHTIAKSFFESIHEWIPIISKKSLYEHVNPFCPLEADYALLILSMALIAWVPGYQVKDPRTSTYLATKSYYQELEIAGILSIQTLQAGILIAIFEMGHAIYPPAFMSVASCARLASTLGIQWRTLLSNENASNSVESEERNRAWWAIVLLDRFASFVVCRPFMVEAYSCLIQDNKDREARTILPNAQSRSRRYPPRERY